MNTMTTKMLGLATVLLAAGAGAQEADSDAWMTAEPSQRSRAEVRAELEQARAGGGYATMHAEAWMPGYGTVRERAAVVAELRHARASGDLERLNAEVYAFGRERQPAVYTLRDRLADR